MSADAGPALAEPIRVRGADRVHCHGNEVVPLILLGTGQVGRALLARLAELDPGERLPLRAAANSRAWTLDRNRLDRRSLIRAATLADADRHSPDALLDQGWKTASGDFDLVTAVEDPALRERVVIVDATASDAVASRHAAWLARGHHVVTANKLGPGASLSRWQAIQHARAGTGAGYGDSATVGAGLPLLSSLRALVAGGDRILSVEGVLSGSLAWLFDRYDGSRPFSHCVREAVAAGYTEPDPRIDLGGEDVRRKLLILARSCGLPLTSDLVRVDALLPPTLAAAAPERIDAALSVLDAPLEQRLARAQAKGSRLRCVARFDANGASVAVQAMPPEHPLAAGRGTDNRVLIHSDRYRQQPLLIQGPGAGADLTAAALLDDLLRIARPQPW